MAGLGSNRPGRRSIKLRTDHYPSVDVRELARNFRLDTFVALEGGVQASLAWRPCYFGGSRVYFKCPRCRGLTCILYRYNCQSKCTDQYGCRKCLDMAYPVENEGKLERSVRRNHKAMKRRRYDPSRPHSKPLWMRWPTWKRLSEQFAIDAMAYFADHEKILMLVRRVNSRGIETRCN
jgi:hypothetical protein